MEPESSPSAPNPPVSVETVPLERVMSPTPAREHDRLLPVANISRIMKRAMPETAKVSKGAKETIQECVSEFIGFITSEASDIIKQDRRKTVTGEDLANAMLKLGFTSYHDYLVQYLEAYRADPASAKSKRKSTKQEPSATSETTEEQPTKTPKIE